MMIQKENLGDASLKILKFGRCPTLLKEDVIEIAISI